MRIDLLIGRTIIKQRVHCAREHQRVERIRQPSEGGGGVCDCAVVVGAGGGNDEGVCGRDID